MLKKYVVAVTTMVLSLTAIASPASAIDSIAYRYWSNGSSPQSITNPSNALSWIQGEAKGSYIDRNGVRQWIVLADQQIQYHYDASVRPGIYANKRDPEGLTWDIQYTLQSMGYDVAPDGIYGPKTTAAVKAFQANHSAQKLTVDGIVGEKTYEVLSWAKH